MLKFNKKIIVLVVLIFIYIAANIKFEEHSSCNYFINRRFPKVINSWAGLNIEQIDFIFNIIPTDELILRNYKKK